jgi:hypothetical protein
MARALGIGDAGVSGESSPIFSWDYTPLHTSTPKYRVSSLFFAVECKPLHMGRTSGIALKYRVFVHFVGWL